MTPARARARRGGGDQPDPVPGRAGPARRAGAAVRQGPTTRSIRAAHRLVLHARSRSCASSATGSSPAVLTGDRARARGLDLQAVLERVPPAGHRPGDGHHRAARRMVPIGRAPPLRHLPHRRPRRRRTPPASWSTVLLNARSGTIYAGHVARCSATSSPRGCSGCRASRGQRRVRPGRVLCRLRRWTASEAASATAADRAGDHIGHGGGPRRRPHQPRRRTAPETTSATTTDAPETTSATTTDRAGDHIGHDDGPRRRPHRPRRRTAPEAAQAERGGPDRHARWALGRSGSIVGILGPDRWRTAVDGAGRGRDRLHRGAAHRHPRIRRSRRGPGADQRRLGDLPRLVRRAPAHGGDRAGGRVPRCRAGRRHRVGGSVGRAGRRRRRRSVEEKKHVRLPRSRPRPGDADLGRQAGTGGRAVPGGDRPRHVRAAGLPQGPLPDAGDVRGRGRRDLRHQAGHRAERPRGHRVQGRQRRREHRQRRPAVPVRPGPDVGADRPDLRRPPALDHRLDDGRGDRHRAAEAGHRGAGRARRRRWRRSA